LKKCTPNHMVYREICCVPMYNSRMLKIVTGAEYNIIRILTFCASVAHHVSFMKS
jgi:hypothetical protein